MSYLLEFYHENLNNVVFGLGFTNSGKLREDGREVRPALVLFPPVNQLQSFAGKGLADLVAGMDGPGA